MFTIRTPDGFEIEARDVGGVLTLMRALGARVQQAKASTQVRSRRPRGASNGDLHGRIMAILEDGPLSPGAVTKEAKATAPQVRMAFQALKADGKTRAVGGTTNRRWMLKP